MLSCCQPSGSRDNGLVRQGGLSVRCRVAASHMWLKSTILHEAVVACVDLRAVVARIQSFDACTRVWLVTVPPALRCFLTPLAVNRDRLRGRSVVLDAVPCVFSWKDMIIFRGGGGQPIFRSVKCD